jgi:myo-inositol-1(or 4)-monophosphatase
VYILYTLCALCAHRLIVENLNKKERDVNYELASFLIPAISLVGERLLAFQPQATKTEIRKKDFVTSADNMSDKLLRAKINFIQTGAKIHSEEDGIELQETNARLWIVDPLDGTINYFHQDSVWGISVALVEKKQTQAGFVCLPALGQIFCCTRNRVVKAPIALKVCGDTDLGQAQIWMDHMKGRAEPIVDLFGKLTRATTCPQIRLCATYSLMQVATGKIAGYVHPGPKPEDFSAAALFVEKAGGRVTDFDGRPWNPFSKSIVATNSLLHDQLLEVINS